jgi:mRNA-capping enzyme
MDQTNIFKLKKPYMVSWKADGTRYMMMILGRDEIYFADRDHCIFKVEGLVFPHPHDKEFRRHLSNTVLDGVRMNKNRVVGNF